MARNILSDYLAHKPKCGAILGLDDPRCDCGLDRVSGWQPIETMPEGVRALVWQPNWPRAVVATRGTSARGRGDEWFQDEAGPTSKPTLWHSLPDPPTPQRGGRAR